tara:strand:+ start:2448 stop:2723 length:276 start_codon:yes stop_codon:yes gene_type:complete
VPRIDTVNDDHTFIVQVKGKGSVCIDAFELSGMLMDSGLAGDTTPTIDQIDEAMREVAWMEDEGSMDSVNKFEMFAVASKVLTRMEQLGNE